MAYSFLLFVKKKNNRVYIEGVFRKVCRVSVCPALTNINDLNKNLIIGYESSCRKHYVHI